MVDIPDNYIPNGAWEFNDEVSRVFPDMISRSIPGYASMRELCDEMCNNIYTRSNQDSTYEFKVLDIGASHGGSTWCLRKNKDVSITLLDERESMTKESIELWKNDPEVKCINRHVTTSAQNWFRSEQTYIDAYYNFSHDFESSCNRTYFNLVLSVLTTMFVPPEHRAGIYRSVYKNIIGNGNFIVVEKTTSQDFDTQILFNDVYWAHKRSAGYSDELIEAKRKSLQRVLMPITPESLESMLRASGFRTVSRFWQCLDFVGFVCTK